MSSSVPPSDFLNPSRSQKTQLLYAGGGLLVALAFLLVFRRTAFSDAYMPHAYCYLQKPGLVWTHVITDLLIGLSYTSISICLAYLVFKGRSDIPFRLLFVAFGVFIVACGGTHFVEATTVWIPVYVFSAAVKTLTAIASVSTAVALPFAVPQALTLIREARLSEERQRALETAIEARDRAQAALRKSHERLQQEVKVRTSELTVANAGLQAEIVERKRMQSSVERLASIVESCDDAIIGKDLSGTITSWNRGAEKMYGYTGGEIIGKSIGVLAPGSRAGEAAEILRRLSRGEHVDHFETVRVSKAGALLDVSLTISPVYDSEGAVVGASTIARDITASKRAELALRESEAQYRLLFDRSPLPMWVFDRKTLRFLAVNEAAVRHYGYARHEFFNMTILDICPSEDVPPLLRDALQSTRGLREMHVWKHRKKDGTMIDVEITAHDLNFQGADGELILAHDVTERLRSEEHLRQSQERFAKAFRSSPFGITISSEGEGRYLDANPAFLTIMGYEREEMIGRTVDELDIWAERRDRELMIGQLNGPQPAKPIEVRFKTRLGKIRLVELAAELIQLNDDHCVLAITRDVTEARLLEQQFRQAQKMEAVGRLAGGIAHDFNNVLGVIIGYSDIGTERLEAGHEGQRYLQEIRKAAHRAAALTRQLLAFSRQQVLKPRVLNLNAVIRNLSKMLSHMIGEDVALAFHPAAELGSVRADPGQIEQVLMNLAVNARDAMPEGGTLTVETSNAYLDENYVGQHTSVEPGAYVMVSVSDTGVGMDADTMARLFEPFFTTKEIGKGTGLGLSTVYGIVKQSGGHVWVYSEPGQGTTFKIYFPRVDQPAENLFYMEHEATAPGGGETVLVVEDDDALRGMTVSVLQSRGYTVLSAGSAAAALAMAQDHAQDIDLLLTDVVLPGIAGPYLVKEFLRHRPKVKVLYMSGYAGSSMTQQGMLEPDSALLSKPFSTHALLTKVRAALER